MREQACTSMDGGGLNELRTLSCPARKLRRPAGSLCAENEGRGEGAHTGERELVGPSHLWMMSSVFFLLWL